MSGRKIPLLEIHKVLLEEHETEGFVRDHPDSHYNAMTTKELKQCLSEIGEFQKDATREELWELLKSFERTRHLMIWSDIPAS